MRLEYDRTADTLTESFGVGGTAKIEGLEQDQSGHVFYDKLTYETISRDGTLEQVYEEGRLQHLSYEYPDHSAVEYECLRDVRCVDEGGNIENGTIRIDLPGHLDPETPPDPQHPPVATPPDFSIFFNVVAGRVAEASVETKVVDNSQSNSNESTDMVLMNGFSKVLSKVAEGTIPEYFSQNNPFRKRVNELGVPDGRVEALHLFETGFIGDVLSWNFQKNIISAEIQAAFMAIQATNKGTPFIALANSGGGEPLLNMLNWPTSSGFAVKTAILVGCPVTTWMMSAQNPLERIVNIYGSEDFFIPERIDQNPTKLPNSNGDEAIIIPKSFTHEGRDFDTINIELQGIDHTHYFYSNSETPTALQKKANDFIAVLSSRSLREIDLEIFLNTMVLDGQATFSEETVSTDGKTNRVRTYVLDVEHWEEKP